MSDRALVARATPDGWTLATATWSDDRNAPGSERPLRNAPDPETFEAVVAGLDFARFAGVYRADDSGAWTSLLACWLAVEPWLGEPTPDPRGDGALVAIRSARDAATLRQWFRAAKGDAVDAVRAGECSSTGARRRLYDALDRRAGDREVVVGDARDFCDPAGNREP